MEDIIQKEILKDNQSKKKEKLVQGKLSDFLNFTPIIP